MDNEEEPKFASFPDLELDSHGVLSQIEKSVSDGTDEAKSAKSGCHSFENAAPQNQHDTTLVPRVLNQQHAGERSSPSAVSAAGNNRLQPPQNLANLQRPLSQPQQFVFSSQPIWVQPHPSIAQPQAPNFCYPVGYPTYPGFPGSWDASTWGAQTQPLLFPGMSNYSRTSYGFVSCQSWPMPAPNCIKPSSVQLLSRGVIKPPEKLSQTHQRLWEAQSAENVQMWNMIGQLQGELADCKGRLIKLEAEILSFRSAAATDEPAAGVGNGGIMVKRRRSKREIAPVCSQPSLQPRTRGRKPRMVRTKVEEPKPKPNVLDITKQDKNEGISASITRNNGIMEIDDATLSGNQALQQLPEIQSSGSEFMSASLSKSNYEGIIGEDSERYMLSIASPTIYSNGNVSRQGTTRWNFKDQDEAS